ncbi:hypothetical protein GBAR_LOCUS28447 [Geodia barretti]|uniref:Uncharacterized protein n=1 Tax=Geodia barretti TaxID=519541 RepID=A0AA35XAY2_GEOBA|nr:hypothetical protein GBAR_LOCUS28447 [Geodia barretti]
MEMCLSGVKFNDELRFKVHGDLLYHGCSLNTPFHFIGIDFEPFRCAALLCVLKCFLNGSEVSASFAWRDDITDLHDIGRNVNTLTVDGEMIMLHQLTCLIPRSRKPEPVNDIV